MKNLLILLICFILGIFAYPPYGPGGYGHGPGYGRGPYGHGGRGGFGYGGYGHRYGYGRPPPVGGITVWGK